MLVLLFYLLQYFTSLPLLRHIHDDVPCTGGELGTGAIPSPGVMREMLFCFCTFRSGC